MQQEQKRTVQQYMVMAKKKCSISDLKLFLTLVFQI